MTKVYLGWDLCWFQLLIELHWHQASSWGVESHLCTVLIYHSSHCRSCKSELPSSFNNAVDSHQFLVGERSMPPGWQCAKTVGGPNLCCGMWAGSATAAERAYVWAIQMYHSTYVMQTVPSFCPWPVANWWSRSEDEVSSGAWGWHLADF